ncbi:glycosyltransferase family 2 protein [Isoptericola sp. NPDC019693]|uniref:glycosyltransferase family 2 protein n=1 Tax=Isoptericola sp. NPDC019693 TaxID=3364009 RepID=UPI00378AF872
MRREAAPPHAGGGPRVTGARPRSARPLPTVSVVIPARDDAAALERCLALLAAQSVPPLEVVVVDNASTDGTADVARRAGAVVVHEPRVGIPAAAAAGYDAARGEVVARLDADSQPGPDWVRAVATRLADDPAAEAVTGSGTFTDLRGGRWVCALYLAAYYAGTGLALGHWPLWGSSMAVRRSTWWAVRDRVERVDPEVHDDLDLAFALGPRRRIVRDRGLRVGVSARSLRYARRRRLVRALRTLRLNWAVAPPWQRWGDRFAAARRGALPLAD